MVQSFSFLLRWLLFWRWCSKVSTHPFGPRRVFELWVVMLWLVLPLHVAGLLGLGVLLLAIRRFAVVFLVRRLGRLSTQLTVALVGFHLAFAVLPRVSLAYQWASARPFVTKAGFLQIVFFVLSCVAFWFLGLCPGGALDGEIAASVVGGIGDRVFDRGGSDLESRARRASGAERRAPPERS